MESYVMSLRKELNEYLVTLHEYNLEWSSIITTDNSAYVYAEAREQEAQTGRDKFSVNKVVEIPYDSLKSS